MKSPLKAVLYARVSSKEQEKEGFSIDAQLKLLRDYAQSNSLTITEEFIDAETAKKAGRTRFLAMVDYLKKNKDVKIILVEKTDRLTRNFQDFVLLDRLMETLDIKIHMVKEGEVLSKDSRSHSKMVYGLKVLLAKLFLDNLAEETSKGMITKASKGLWPSKAPYGYLNNKETRLVDIDPLKSRYVKRAFELYATGEYSIKRLIDALHKEGLIFRVSKPKPSTSNVHHILTNRFYTGHIVFKNIDTIGHHPPLVSMELFKRVQRQLQVSNKPNYEKRHIAYAKLISCGHCGCTVVGDVKQKGRYVYYRCTHYKEKCPDGYIREEALHAQFIEIVKAFSITEEQYAWAVEGLKEANELKDREVSSRINHIEIEATKLNNRLSQLYEDKLDGLIDTERYKRLAKETQERLDALEIQRQRVNDAGQKQMALGLKILEFMKNAYPEFLKKPLSEQGKFLKIALSKCELKGGKLYPTYNKPFDVVAEGSIKDGWYPQGNSNPCLLRERELS